MRGKGEGSVYKDAKSGLWVGTIELPSYDGTRRRKVIRRKMKKDLLAALTAARAELKLLGNIRTDGQTVEQWFTYWYNEIAAKNVRPNTLAGYKSVVFKHIIPAIGKVRLDAVNDQHIKAVHDRITEDKKLSSTYALLAHRTMRVAFKYAMKASRISRNPADLVDAPRKRVTNLEALTLEEALRVLDYVTHTESAMGARWATSLITGARRGEVLGLEWDRVNDVIDFSWQLQRIESNGTDGKPNVPADFEYRHLKGGLYLVKPKSKKGERTVPVVEPLKSILEIHRRNSADNEWGLVFTSPARQHPIDPARDTRAWRELLKELGITKNVRLHDLRHTAVDLLSYAGVRDDDIMALVGHSTRAMTQEYKSRFDIDRLRKAMELYSGLFTAKAIEDTPRQAAG